MQNVQSAAQYEAPRLAEIGRVEELTLAECEDKSFGPSDGHTFMGIAIQCSSA